VFCNVAVSDVAARLCTLIEQYRPQVLIAYDDKGPYQHPDHVHASLSAQQAFADSEIPVKLYLSAFKSSEWRKVWEALKEAGEQVPDWEDEQASEAARMARESEARITSVVDIRKVLSRKRDALFAHSSQIQDSWFSKLPEPVLEAAFGKEHFILAGNRIGSPVPETDLFAGLR
jgi:LmbE family N-acetylglucosaminyl deacetylase